MRAPDVVGAGVVVAHGLAQLRRAQAVGVVGVAPLDSGDAGRFDGLRRVEIGLAQLQVYHLLAGALELLGALQDVHGDERLQAVDAVTDHLWLPWSSRILGWRW
ncbi:MAG: hypothetical protein BWY79_01680 [Actinobacteria bacterium ADurb.Bin444]|nr:MAG: hypothetical protein BWY79_01680 [Actinobacteria bacterium ADurb.Bin444]